MTAAAGRAGTDPALLLVGHGSRSAAGVAEYFALADRIRALAPNLAVGTGFIELSPPPISVAVSDLIGEGFDHVVVVPLVLFHAGHAKTDVPASIESARHDFPGVRFRYGRALGVHPDLLAVVDERLDATLDARERVDTAVLLVGRGSSDPDANADLAKAARLYWEGRDYPLVEACFVGITSPRVSEGLDRLRRLGARRIAVVPYFLFTGVLEERIRAQSEAFAGAHADVHVQVTRYLGPDDRVARLVLARYAEAAGGDVRVNCDACIHRVAMPGFAGRVGAPQVLHHHPDDAATHSSPHSQAHG
ncbi:MAG: sirohydrochlorin chelatase [Nitriliruptorales bacterium]|nr:sirohydrochlorin chelatase [Nitriliruptorales bacterium]